MVHYIDPIHKIQMNNANHGQQQELQESYEGASFLQDYQEEDDIPEDFVDHISSIEEGADRSRLAHHANRSALAAGVM